MDTLFIVASLLVLGGVVWALTRKRNNTSGIVGGPPTSGGDKDNDGTVKPPRNGDGEIPF